MMTAVFNRLGPYEIERQIGRGGMADVYLATDTRTGLPVALKVVSRANDPEQHDIVQAEQQGAELQRRFSALSGFVPAVYDQGLEGDFFYVAMEYCDGLNLSAVIAAGLPLARALTIASELCRFIEDAEGFEATMDGKPVRSLIHGDLTPGNVRVLPSGQLKILDFGIAKALSLSRKVTRNDFGNLAYLSPERLATGEVDRHADFWAVGVLLYEMVRGERPFIEADTRQLEKRILARRPPPSLNGRSPLGVQAIVAKLLAPTVSDRYDNASAIREDLQRTVAGVPTVAEQEGWPNGAGTEPSTQRTRPSPALDPEATRRMPVSGPSADAHSVGASLGTDRGSQPPAARRIGKRRAWLPALLILLVAGLLLNEMWLGAQAGRAARMVTGRDLDNMSDLWDRYDTLKARSNLRFGPVSLRQSLVSRTSMLAERVIADYRASQPSVREAQWKKAREALARATRVSSDTRLRAMLRYCEGHLYRINGEADLGRRQLPEARQEFSQAVTAFRDAAEARPNWPDPFLGLARTFIVGLQDIERGADALKQAERFGYLPGDRETAQLADGYRTRGDTLARNARQLHGLPQERDLFSRAAEAYRLSIELYMKAMDYGDAPRNLRNTQRELERVEERIGELPPISMDRNASVTTMPWA